jgi:hypothetical protein
VARGHAEQALRALAAAGHRAEVAAAAADHGGAAEAVIDELLAADPHPAYPLTVRKLPGWAAAGSLPPVRVRGDAGVLPEAAVWHLTTMLSISKPGRPCHGLAEATAACDPTDLAELGWALFDRWQAVGAPAREGWVFDALGLIGDDTTVRRLAPMIRSWPGSGRHARAVAGLDVLAAIGSEVSLTYLDAIARKARFRGLRERASEKLHEVAAAMGLSAEELADRVVPDLGLDATGSTRLDYGPRQFVVGFDERLKPYVTDGDGRRRATLPKPATSDAPELAGVAYARFVGLKKDVRAIAADQIRRLEQAMVTQRRWPAKQFRDIFIGHPLLWHIVCRLVLVRYAQLPDGVAPAGGLRIAEDRTFADVHDEPLPVDDAAIIGIAHPLHLGGGCSAWAELFADYEILQPFAQLGRDCFELSETERPGLRLSRFEGSTVATRRLLGLERFGWRRSEPGDSGHQGWIERPTPCGRSVVLSLDPGIAIGSPDLFPEQTLEEIWVCPAGASHWAQQRTVPFGALDPVTTSEIIKDLRTVTR